MDLRILSSPVVPKINPISNIEGLLTAFFYINGRFFRRILGNIGYAGITLFITISLKNVFYYIFGVCLS